MIHSDVSPFRWDEAQRLLILLDQLDEAMAFLRDTYLAQFGSHPVGIRQSALDEFGHQLIEFVECKYFHQCLGLCRAKVIKVAEISAADYN